MRALNNKLDAFMSWVKEEKNKEKEEKDEEKRKEKEEREAEKRKEKVAREKDKKNNLCLWY